MEKIRVNMTPCEEVKTIHASQNDDATRKWAFDLYDENGKIDPSSIKEQMIFDSRVGGTEQILPENTSDPTTSPIIADIQYPDSLRSEQTFLYRESPTSEDGQAKITRIKGNTVVFNQLVQNGNFADTSIWSKTSTTTLTVSGNVASVAYNGGTTGGRITQGIARKAGHKYLISCELKLSSLSDSIEPIIVNNGSELIRPGFADSTSWKTYTLIFNQLADDDGSTANNFRICSIAVGTATSAEVRNVNMHDLTQMGLDYITSADQFTSLYPLPYYDYTQGKLLPFKGESLKTVGKNLIPITSIDYLKEINDSGTWSGNIYSYHSLTFEPQTDGNGKIVSIVVNGTADSRTFFYVSFRDSFKDGDYILTGCPSGGASAKYRFQFQTLDTSYSQILVFSDTGSGVDVTIDSTETPYQTIRCSVESGFVANNLVFKPMLRLADVQDATFVPYETNTLSLPILDFFPSGMKDCSQSAQVFDEIADGKAVTRVGEVDLGTPTWTYYTGGAEPVFYSALDNLVQGVDGQIGNIKCPLYNAISSRSRAQFVAYASDLDMQITASARTVMIKNLAYTSAESFKTAMSGVYLYFELATPTEESITTASLVTEKGEAPLYYDDELIADCNETISSESGIFDAKIKLMDDNTIYSQKIQLHVERKPQ